MPRFLTLVVSVWLVVALHPAKALTYTENFDTDLGNWSIAPSASPSTTLFWDGGNQRAQTSNFGPPFDAHIHNSTDTFDIAAAGDVLTFDIDVDFVVSNSNLSLELYLVDASETMWAGFNYNLGTGDITQVIGGSAMVNVTPLTWGSYHTMSLELSYDGTDITPVFSIDGTPELTGDMSAFTPPKTMHAMFGYNSTSIVDSQIAYFDNVSITLAPEPSAAILFVSAAMLLFVPRRRRRR